MQQLVELCRVRRAGSLPSLLISPLVHHVHRDLDGGLAGALAVAGLQHVELAFLDGELEVLHVAIVLLQVAA